nr:succinate dehydrogenase [ubiquinone] cytochrome b small subunit, mitochondrial isoform X2 [Hydra vulgaris]
MLFLLALMWRSVVLFLMGCPEMSSFGITQKYFNYKYPEKKRVYHTSVKNLSQKFALPNDPSHGSKHWMTERVVAVGLLGLIPMGIIYPLPTIDHLLAVALPLHSYWGVKAILVDYFWRPGLPVAKATWMLACFFTCGGLIYLNVYDVGICKFFALLMSL